MADLHLLCIDNEPAILDGMATLLTGWGCTVATAPDLHAALAAQADAPAHGLIVDYHLDVGTGLDAIAALRAVAGAALPAVLITADRSPQVRDAARANGIALLHKPVKPAALRALIAPWRMSRVAAE